VVPWLGAPHNGLHYPPEFGESLYRYDLGAAWLQAEYIQHAVRMGVELFGVANYVFRDEFRASNEASIDAAILAAEPHAISRDVVNTLIKPRPVSLDARHVCTAGYVTTYNDLVLNTPPTT
jgi:hypothetical protein